MDLLAFATFVLAWDHRNQSAAIPYFFKIFDINHRVRFEKNLLLQVFEHCVVPGLQFSRLVLPSRPCPTWGVLVAIHHTNTANLCWALMLLVSVHT